MTTENTKRDAIIERIRKLQRMTIDRGASEAEATTASERVSALRTEYAISESELSIRADANSCIRDALTCVAQKATCWQRTAVAVERLYGTICWLECKREDILELGFEVETTSVLYYGFPLDVAASIATLAMIGVALDTELASLGRKGKKFKDSFELGYAERVNARLRELKQRSSNAFRDASKGALVVVKEQVVKSEFDKLGIKCYRKRASGEARDARGYAAGQAAGNRLGLDTKLSGASAQAMQIGQGG